MRNYPPGIILSGSPYSVYDKDSPHVDTSVFDLDIPILGICYGLQVSSVGNYLAKLICLVGTCMESRWERLKM